MPDKTEFRPDLPGKAKDHGSPSERAAEVAQVVRKEATAVGTAASEHPYSFGLLIALVGVTGFLLGHASGYRSAEQQLPPARRFW